MNAALGIALLELAMLGALSVPMLVMQPGIGFSLVGSALLGAIAGRWVLSKWLLPRWFAESEPRPLATGEWVWSLGVGIGFAARIALLVLAAGTVVAASHGQLVWMVLGLLVAGMALAGLGTRLWEGALAIAFVGCLIFIWVRLAGYLEGEWDTYRRVLVGAQKHRVLDLRADAAALASAWSGLTLGTVQTLVLLGADPLARERWQRGGTLAAARRTLWGSLVYLLPLGLLVAIGVALFAWQERAPLDPGGALTGQHMAARLRDHMGPVGCWMVGLGWLALALHSTAAWLAHGAGRMRWLRAGLLIAGLVLFVSLDWQPWPAAEWLARVAWGVLGGLLALHWIGLRPRGGNLFWSLALVVLAAGTLHSGGVPGQRVALVALAILWFGSRTLVQYFGHGRRMAALIDLGLVLGWLVWVDWLTRHGSVPVARNPVHDEGWIWLPLSPAWYVPLCGGAFFALNCWFARHRAD